MTKLNDTKIKDILLMYQFYKRINHQYSGKIFKNIVNSLAKGFKLSISTIRAVVNGKKKGSKAKEETLNKIDNFDREALRKMVIFYSEVRFDIVSSTLSS